MQKIGIVTEDGADLPREIIEKYQIAIAPIYFNWPEVENLAGENTFQKMREAEKQGIKSFGKTSQPSLKDFLEAFKKQLSLFNEVICITLTSKLSGTFNSAVQARNFLKPEEQKRVSIVDSLNFSAGEGLLLLLTIDLIEQGKDMSEIVKELQELVKKISLFGIIKDPKWVEASGRMSSLMANWIRKAAKIGVRPLIKAKDGVLASGGIVTGAKDIPTALFKRFELETRESRKKGKQISVVVTHGDDTEGSNRLKEMIEKEFKEAKVVFQNIIDNVIGVLAGPDTILLSWCEV